MGDVIPQLGMSLDVAFAPRDLEEVQARLEPLLGVSLEWTSDLELGGAYLECSPSPLPDVGVSGVRLLVNELPGRGHFLPHRPDMGAFASIGFFGTDVLDLGRLAAAIGETWRDAAVIASCTVGGARPGAAGPELWRGRRDEIDPPSDGAAAMLCQLSYGLPGEELEAAAAAARRAFDVDFHRRDSADLGGVYLEHVREVPPGQVSEILIRRNLVRPRDWLHPARQEHAWLLDITLRARTMVDPGMAAAFVEARCGDAARVLAYRIAGDLVRDRVPRLVSREFESPAAAASLWRRGPSAAGGA